jgi:hypothetical protein
MVTSAQRTAEQKAAKKVQREELRAGNVKGKGEKRKWKTGKTAV